MLEHTFLYLSREDVEVLQVSFRYFLDLISAECFQKVAPLRRLQMLQLLNDGIAIWKNGKTKRFGYDSEDVVRWLRNTCVKSLGLYTALHHQLTRREAERALRWFVAHRAVFRVVAIDLKLPFINDVFTHAFLHPIAAHHWTAASIQADVPGDVPANLPLMSSALEHVERLFVSGAHIQVTVDDVIRWLHRPVSPYIGIECRKLTLDSRNIGGELQRLLEAIREVTSITNRRLPT